MSILFTALMLALQGQPQSSDGVILAMSADTAFVLPLSSLHRTGQGASATLVSIYADGSEAWEEVRRDNVVEINCSKGQWRSREVNRIARDGTVRSLEAKATRWSKLPTNYPPVAALKAIVCDGLDLSSTTLSDWENKLPEIRGRLR